jgi:hypothetical protein
MSQYAIPQIYSSCESAGCVTLIAPPSNGRVALWWRCGECQREWPVEQI